MMFVRLSWKPLTLMDPASARFILIWVAVAGGLSLLAPGSSFSTAASWSMLLQWGVEETAIGFGLIAYGLLEVVAWLAGSRIYRIAVSITGIFVWSTLGSALLIGGASMGAISLGTVTFAGMAAACAWSAIQTQRRGL